MFSHKSVKSLSIDGENQVMSSTTNQIPYHVIYLNSIRLGLFSMGLTSFRSSVKFVSTSKNSPKQTSLKYQIMINVQLRRRITIVFIIYGIFSLE